MAVSKVLHTCPLASWQYTKNSGLWTVGQANRFTRQAYLEKYLFYKERPTHGQLMAVISENHWDSFPVSRHHKKNSTIIKLIDGFISCAWKLAEHLVSKGFASLYSFNVQESCTCLKRNISCRFTFFFNMTVKMFSFVDWQIIFHVIWLDNDISQPNDQLINNVTKINITQLRNIYHISLGSSKYFYSNNINNKNRQCSNVNHFPS